MNCWAMRTSREEKRHREFLYEELQEGRLRQGWGYDQCQNLRYLEERWARSEDLTDIQRQASGHWRMGNAAGGTGATDDYMRVSDLVVVPNLPEDGLFTICRITGEYYFDIAEEFGDFGHIRPVKILTSMGVCNTHNLVSADLRRSFRCPSRMWNITLHEPCLTSILDALNGGLPPGNLTSGIVPEERVESVVSDMVTEVLSSMGERLAEALPAQVRAQEWEPVLKSVLEPLFPISVYHTGGSSEQGADIEIVISNPFEEDRNWIVPVQVKDHEDEVGGEVANQLQRAFDSRSEHGRVIAVVLLVTNAICSMALSDRMDELSKKNGVPFVYCSGDQFWRLLARGLLAPGGLG